MNEERNVLDELLLDNDDDEDFDAELRAAKIDRRSKKTNNNTTDSSKSVHHMKKDNKDNRGSSTRNGNSKPRYSRESSYASHFSCESGSCSCENHSSIGDDVSPKPKATSPAAGSDCSYQSFTRSPSLKIKITKNSNSRTIAKSSQSPTSPRLRDGSNNISLKRKHKSFDGNYDLDDRVLKRSRRDTSSKILNNNKKDTSSSSKKRDYSSLIKYFFKDSCYFVMKSNNEENVEISKSEGVWSTPMANEIKLNSAFKEFRNVILIFSVKESGKFQGFARLASAAQYDLEPVRWVLPPGVHTCPFNGVFFVDWICRNELPFTKTSHLFNDFNEGKPIKIARDGQEIEPKAGEELCRLFPPDDFVDLIPLLKRMKKQTLDRPRKHHSRGPFMVYDRVDNERSSRVKSHIIPGSLPPSYNHSIKKRLDMKQINYPDHYHSNRMRDDRYARIPPTRRVEYPNHSMNGFNDNHRYPDTNHSGRRYSSSMHSSSSSSYYNNNSNHSQYRPNHSDRRYRDSRY